MSIDFDSAALQTQHEEEEYDPEDYAREQELHKLLTDLPDDMLDDSVDSSCPDLECSTCSNKNTGNRPQPAWTQPAEWLDHQRPGSHEENYEDDYEQGSNHEDYAYEDEADQISGHDGHPPRKPLPQTWNNQEGYEPEPYPHTASNPVVYEEETGRREKHNYGEQNNTQKHFQNFDPGSLERGVDHYQVSYNPRQPKVFSSQAHHQGAHFDHLQREFLDATHNTADGQQLAQLQILNKAQKRQIEDLERKLEDSRRNMRYLEHQFAIVKDEKDGLAVSLKESSRLVEEAKEREAQMQNRMRSLEQEVKALTERDHENMKKQRLAEAAVDSVKQQMQELRRSDALTRVREQHDRDLTVMKEQHEARLLALQERLDSTSQALSEQTEAGLRLREQVKQLERLREEEQVERAGVVNALSQRLEESQQQCAKLLQTGSVLEMSQMQIKLQQAQSAKALSENMTKALQEDLADLKEQITLYESALKHGVIALDLNGDWENQLSESYVDLGIKKSNWTNGKLRSMALADLSESKLPPEEAQRELRAELQRCLASLKGKRERIGQLREELRLCQGRVDELQTELEQTQHSSMVKGSSQASPMDMTGAQQKELLRLKEDKQHLQEQVESLEKKNKELRQSEEKVRSANAELCTKMREMIQELDQEKQETAERHERIQQQYRDDVVNRVRTELLLEHQAQVDQLSAQHEEQVQQLQAELSVATDKIMAAQEFYITVCKEKDLLEERREEKEAAMRENEVKLKQEGSLALERLRAELEAQHQASVDQLKALWTQEKEADIQQQVSAHVASAKARWKEDQEKKERTWVQKLQEASRQAQTAEGTSQTDESEAGGLRITIEELDSRLTAQRQHLQLEADKAKRQAVEEARKQTETDLQEKHLEDMVAQVEGALTRAYSRWLEDLTSLPEYKDNLQREKAKWEQLQETYVQQQVSQALRVAEDQSGGRSQREEQGAGAQRLEELQEKVASLQGQLERARGEQAALLKAELAGARAAWNRDRQQEISSVQRRTEQEWRGRLEQGLQQAREEAGLQKKELLAKMALELQQAVAARDEEWRSRQAETERVSKQQAREALVEELQTGLADARALLLRDPSGEQQNAEEKSRASRASQEGSITSIVHASLKDTLTKALAQAKKDWKKISEERLGLVLKETQELHQREISKIQNPASQAPEEARCGKHCAQAVSKLHKKNQELQRHLEKACRHLQQTVRDNKATTQRLTDEHKASLQQLKEEQQQKLEEVRGAKESSGASPQQQQQQQQQQFGLEEMKQQYLTAVDKIRGDMLRYLQESKERAAEMIRVEVQRERQDTARRMRRYYLTCLQELLEEGGQTAGAEKKIMNAASKLAALAKVMETPVKRKTGKSRGLSSSSKAAATSDKTQSRSADLMKNPSAAYQVSESRSEGRALGDQPVTDPDHHPPIAVRTKTLMKATCQDIPLSGSREASSKPQSTTPGHLLSNKPSRQTSPASPVDFINVTQRGKSGDVFLPGGDSWKVSDYDHGPQSKHFLIQEPPVKDQGESDWSLVSNDSRANFQLPSLSYSGREAEPVKPFSLGSAPSAEPRGFGSLTLNSSDVTVYKEIAKMPPHSKASSFPGAKTSALREPIPGSEGERLYTASCSKTLFSELRQCQQDSGFNSPFFQPK